MITHLMNKDLKKNSTKFKINQLTRNDFKWHSRVLFDDSSVIIYEDKYNGKIKVLKHYNKKYVDKVYPSNYFLFFVKNMYDNLN